MSIYLKNEGIPIEIYFRENTPEKYQNQHILNTNISQLRRSGVETMNALCAMSDEEIARIKNIGEKRRELVLLMRNKYRKELGVLSGEC